MGSGWIRAYWRRVVNVAFGIALIGIGVGSEGGTTGLLLVAVGLIPLAAGLFGWCPATPRTRDEAESGVDEEDPDGV